MTRYDDVDMYAILNILTGSLKETDMFGRQFFPSEEEAKTHVSDKYERVVRIQTV